jgi:probable F420-dependent oxidoreductase
MEIGVVYPQVELKGDPEAVRQIGLATEALGYDYLLAYDHVLAAEHADRDPKLWGPYTEADPFHDPFVLFAYLAGITERIGFASGVLILPQRQTALVAKQAADLDLLCGERFRLGIGVGWNHVEYTALGQDFSTRGARADEQIELLRRLWSEPTVDWQGRFDQVERAGILPRPNRSIPIWIGGFSEPAFRRGATLGDGFMFAGGIQNGLDGMARIEAIASDEGRDLSGFGKEFICLAAEDPVKVTDGIKQWREAGGTHFAVSTMGLGLDSADAHVDYMAAVRDKFGE